MIPMLKRRPGKKTHNSFKRRVNQTARLNVANPVRGGIRL